MDSLNTAVEPQPGAVTDWFDTQDLGRRYKCSPRHIARMADSGRMPWGTKIGNLRRWSRREIECWESTGCKPVRTAKGGAI